jgi:hypothetical protein
MVKSKMRLVKELERLQNFIIELRVYYGIKM